MTRVILLVFGSLTAGAGAVTYYGVGAESASYAKSVRSGSAGGIGYIGGVK